MAKDARALQRAGGRAAHLLHARIALVTGATPDLLIEPLSLALQAFGIDPELHSGGFGQFPFALLESSGELADFAPQLAIVHPTHHDLPAWPEVDAGLDNVNSLVDAACEHLLGPCRAFHNRTGCEILLCNLHAPTARPMGNLGARFPGDPVNFVRRVNLALGDRLPEFVRPIDVAHLVERHGLERWFDPRLWFAAKQAVAPDCIPAFALACAAAVSASLGRSRKCLVVDLDDTLWGGVVGEVGSEGLELGPGSAAGEAFLAFQRYLVALRRRGVLLAVCSKNDEQVALSAIEKHPEMVLRSPDFVSIQASWGPKSDGIRAIAEQLGLGLDAFVFVDDNPAECEQVRRALPEVAVPDMGDDPAGYVGVLESARYFEPGSFTPEDRSRTEAYRNRATAAASAAESADLSSYLASLRMRATLSPFDDLSLERVVQLCNKTNQFNLTTRRVTAPQIREIAGNPAYVTLAVRLRDRFGDHGLISVFYGRIEGPRLTIEQWLMSCRVLKRGVEDVVLGETLRLSRARGVEEIVGSHVASGRNGMVQELFARYGFDVLERSHDRTDWIGRVASLTVPVTSIEVERP